MKQSTSAIKLYTTHWWQDEHIRSVYKKNPLKSLAPFVTLSCCDVTLIRWVLLDLASKVSLVGWGLQPESSHNIGVLIPLSHPSHHNKTLLQSQVQYIILCSILSSTYSIDKDSRQQSCVFLSRSQSASFREFSVHTASYRSNNRVLYGVYRIIHEHIKTKMLFFPLTKLTSYRVL